MVINWATSEELENFQKELLEECFETGRFFQKELQRQAEEARTSRQMYAYYEMKHLRSNIYYRKWKIGMIPKYNSVLFTFYGKIKDLTYSGHLNLDFQVKENKLKFNTNLVFEYPFKTQIIEMIIKKFDINSKEEMMSFIRNIAEKRIEFV